MVQQKITNDRNALAILLGALSEQKSHLQPF